MAGAFEIVSDCLRVVIIEENNEEQGNAHANGESIKAEYRNSIPHWSPPT